MVLSFVFHNSRTFFWVRLLCSLISDCGALASPTDGNVSAPSTTSGSEASYSCNTGYNMNGAATRTCEAGGTWSGTAPTCVIVGE